MNQTTFIYALRCPATGEIRYVGRSTNPVRRYQQHMSSGVNSRKDAWIAALKQYGMRPDLVLLDYCKTSEYKRVEDGWIQYFLELGSDLVNGIYKGYDREETVEAYKWSSFYRLKEMVRIEAS